MNKNKVLKNILVSMIISVVTVFVIFSLTGTKGIFKVLKWDNSYIFVISFFIFFLVIVIDSLRSVMLSKVLSYKLTFLAALRNSILFYFISDITPLAAGGQPYQIYHYTKYGISTSDSTNIVLSRFVEYIFTSTIIGFFGYIYLRSTGTIGLIGRGSSLFLAAFIVSVMSGIFVLLPMIYPKVLIYLYKIVNVKFISSILKRLNIDNIKIESNIEKFDLSLKTLWKKNLYIMILDIFLGFVDIVLQALSLYIVFIWAGMNVVFIDLFGIFVLLNLIVYYVPTPGASGGLEGIYFLIFSNLFDANNSVIMTSIAVWRISTFYLVIFIGFIVFIVENTLKGVKINEDSGFNSNV